MRPDDYSYYSDEESENSYYSDNESVYSYYSYDDSVDPALITPPASPRAQRPATPPPAAAVQQQPVRAKESPFSLLADRVEGHAAADGGEATAFAQQAEFVPAPPRPSDPGPFQTHTPSMTGAQKATEGFQLVTGAIGAVTYVQDAYANAKDGEYVDAGLGVVKTAGAVGMAVHDGAATAGVALVGGSMEPISGAVMAFADVGFALNGMKKCWTRSGRAKANGTKLDVAIQCLGTAMAQACIRNSNSVCGMNHVFTDTTLSTAMLTLEEAAQLNTLLHACLLIEDHYAKGKRSEFNVHGRALLAGTAKLGLNVSAAVVIGVSGTVVTGGALVAAGAVVGIGYAAGHCYRGWRRTIKDRKKWNNYPMNAGKKADIESSIQRRWKQEHPWLDWARDSYYCQGHTSIPVKHRVTYSDFMAHHSRELKREILLSDKYNKIQFLLGIIEDWD